VQPLTLMWHFKGWAMKRESEKRSGCGDRIYAVCSSRRDATTRAAGPSVSARPDLSRYKWCNRALSSGLPLGCFKRRAGAAQCLMQATNRANFVRTQPGPTICMLPKRVLSDPVWLQFHCIGKNRDTKYHRKILLCIR
jgi:hypothetical protein